LPAARRHDEGHVRQRIHLDWVGWHQPEEPVPHLRTIHQAVWQDRSLHIAYPLEIVSYVKQFERLVDPYGLVAKAGVWYLVCAGDGRTRILRVSQILDAHIADERFQRPADFDLATFWDYWCVRQEESRPSYPVTARVSPNIVPFLPRYFGERIHIAIARAGPPDAAGWITLTLPFETASAARERILGFGSAVEVLEPEPLRKNIIDYAVQIVAFYDRVANSSVSL
jgi:predicted DNA-binding transcriptional regulator YafY